MDKQNFDDIYKEDIFNRKFEIRELMKYIRFGRNSPFTIALNSKWGNGKTTFVKIWKREIKEKYKNYTPIYINAWENDDFEDPLLLIIKILQENKELKEEVFDENLKDCMNYLTKNMPKVLGKLFLDFAIKDEKTNKKIKEVFEELSQNGVTIENIKKFILKSHSELDRLLDTYNSIDSENLRHQIKTTLKEALKNLNLKERKIIFFVDELDRCKPIFAIKMLETIKHFFDIPNFIFIFSWDLEQLSYSLGHVYGEKIDSAGYLRRFIDFNYDLEEVEIQKLYGRNLDNLFYKFSEAFKLSLRDIEKMEKIVNENPSYCRFISKNEKNTLKLLLGYFFLFIRYKEPIVYIKLQLKKMEESEKEKLELMCLQIINEIYGTIENPNEPPFYPNDIREIVSYVSGKILNYDEIEITQGKLKDFLDIDNTKIGILDILKNY